TLNQSYPTGATDANKVLSATYYDDYAQQATWGAGFAFVPEMGHTAASQNTRVKGLVTGSLTQVLGSSPVQWLKSVTYYDSKYRPIQTITENHLGGTDRVTTTYDFIGQATATQRTHTASGQPTLVLKERFDYDHAGRLLRHYHQVGAQAEVLLAEHSYNELGQLVEKDLHSENNGGSHLQSVDYRYNIRGWLSSINNHNFSNDAGATNNDTNDLFGMTLRYNTGLSTGAGTAQYNGNIGEIIWREKQGNKLQGYGFSYDAMNRLTSANYRHYSNSSWTGSAENNRFNESISLYDKNGNIKALSRNSEIGAMDILDYTYEGNRLVRVHDTGNAAQGFVNGSTSTTATEYTYDANGNMDYDANKRIQVSYNHLNLPSFVDILPSGAPLEHQVRYTYDASGQKLRKVDDVAGNLTSTDYIGGIHYENNLLTFVQTAEGRVRKDGTSWVYEYNLTDHLGNVRVSFDKNPTTGVARLIQKDDYYPFGMTFNHPNVAGDNKYLYNSKELQQETDWYDYGARMYDAALGRWMVVDPLSELTRRWSPYTYCYNNPLIFIDPDGMYGEYYGWDGKYLGSDKIDDKKVYVAEGVSKDKEGTVTSATNAQDLGVTHDEFATSANVVKHESSGNKDESLWIAHAANNAKDNDAIDYKKQNNTLNDQLTDKNYSTTPESARTPLSSSDNSSKANNARSAVIDVYTGGADPTGGAVLWDGDDFLKKGSTHNKFKEYTNVSISTTDLWNHAMVPRRPGASIDGTFWPSLVFKSNFSQAGNSKRNYSLNSTGAKGRSIFWRIQKK
ncbi:RHS repeat-associated core domain-containing protein, partial [Cytophagales bacterium LB-30]